MGNSFNANTWSEMTESKNETNITNSDKNEITCQCTCADCDCCKNAENDECDENDAFICNVDTCECCTDNCKCETNTTEE